MSDALFDLTDRAVLVTGGARGLGQSLATGLAERGAKLVIADRLADEGEEAVAALPGEGHGFVQLDLTDEASVRNAVAATHERFGRLDAVVNSAGIATFAPALEMSLDDFRKTLEVNITGAYILSREAARLMRDQSGGRIIHLASVSSRVANPKYAAYSTSKAGLSQLIKILALEWAEYGITVNGIGPAMTPTPLTARQLLADEESTNRALSQIPAGRFGTPEDLLGVTLLLASGAGSFITGQTLFVDGGRTLV